MTPMDIFDSMLESIQQFPLECSYYERNIKRLCKDQAKYSHIFDKLIQKMVSLDDPRFLKIQRKIKKTLKKKIELTNKFQSTIEKQQQKLEELIKISSVDLTNFNFTSLTGNCVSMIKLSDTPKGNNKYCICNDKAFGNMICCDNPSCSVKWYHLKCANLLLVPKGSWTCSKCLTIQ